MFMRLIMWLSVVLVAAIASPAEAQILDPERGTSQCSETPRLDMGELDLAKAQASSLFQAHLSRRALPATLDEPASDSQSPLKSYSSAEVDRAIWQDYVHDDQEDQEGAADAAKVNRQDVAMSTRVGNNGDLTGTRTAKDISDDNFVLDVYGSGSAKELCWRPPKMDAHGVVSDPKHRHVWAPIDKPCPPECPYTQELAEEKCYKACVEARYCKGLHPFRTFGDNNTMMCAATCGSDVKRQIVGCLECSSPAVCSKCSFWRSLQPGGRECHDNWQYLWHALHYLAGSTFIVFVVFILYLTCKPVVSVDLFDRANLHRQLCKPWKISIKQTAGTAEAEKFPLTTKTHADDVTGVGMVLYFRWLLLMLVFSVVLCALCYFTFCVSVESVPLLGRKHGSIPASAQTDGQVAVLTEPSACEHSKYHAQADGKAKAKEKSAFVHRLARVWEEQYRPIRTMKKVKAKIKLKAKVKFPLIKTNGKSYSDVPAGHPGKFSKRMAFTMMLTYLMLTGASLWYTTRQADFFRSWRTKKKQYSDYAVFVSCLPLDEVNPARLRTFFQAAMDRSSEGRQASEIIGVSICYDFSEQSGKLAIFKEFYSRLREKIDILASRSVWADVETETSPAPPSPREPTTHSRATPAIFRPFEFFVSKLIPREDEQDDANEETEDWEAEAKEELRKIRGTGYAYVIVDSESACEQLINLSGIQGPNAGGSLVLQACDTEPPHVIWHAHGHVPSKLQMVKHVAILIFTIFLWAAMFTPYALYHLTAEAIPGHELSGAADFVLGMMIAAGNQFVTISIDSVVKHLGLTNMELQDSVNMCLVYLTTIFNTMLDICIVLVALRGISLELALHGTLDQSHYDRVLSAELYALIVPGYLITPYLISPIVEDIIPRIMNKRLIRSTTRVSRHTCESKYMCPTYDLSWHYSDLLTNFSVCLPMLLFETHHMYTIMCVLVACNILNYTIDHFRLLRATTETPILNNTLDTAFMQMWALPLGMLGSIAIHWFIVAGLFDPGREMEKLCIILWIPLHMVVYITLARWLRGSAKGEATEVSYQTMEHQHWSRMRFYNYFNTNHVQVLRSWLLHDPTDTPSDRFIVPYKIGKEHLMLLDSRVAKHEYLKEAMRVRFVAASVS